MKPLRGSALNRTCVSEATAKIITTSIVKESKIDTNKGIVLSSYNLVLLNVQYT